MLIGEKVFYTERAKRGNVGNRTETTVSSERLLCYTYM